MSELQVRLLDPAAVLPRRAHPGDAGLDLHALHAGTLAPGARTPVRTGIAIALPPGHAGLVLPRSGLAARNGVTLANAPGLIDAGYRGELQVLLLNADRHEPFAWAAGDRIAQLVVIVLAAAEPVAVTALDATARGAGGFGSTGT